MKINLFLFFILLVQGVMAQPVFLVYRVTGSVKLKTGKQNTALQIGQQLNSNNTVRLDKGASLVLICEGYAHFEIKKSGDHLLTAYLDSCKKDGRSVTGKYFQYVWEELTHPHTTPEDNRRKYMQNTGAPVRGCPGIRIDPVFDTLNNYTGDVRVTWKSSAPLVQVSFALFDSKTGGKLITAIPVKDNSIHLDTIKKYSGDQEEVYWNIAANGQEMCTRKLVKFWQKEDYYSFLKDLQKNLEIIPGEAERYYATGFVLEANHFLAEARAFYKKAMDLQPRNKKYREPLTNDAHER